MECPDCDFKLIEDIEETYCPKCGLVVDDSPVFFGMDWDNWDGNFDDARAGKPGSYLDGDTNRTKPTAF